ncbi:ribokinase [Diaminobutyricibacter tongyongensis]|uniref:Ribokinase n=1 Tax=Leifsonia tongyongensis TaxID=1268043 RepID=A0A6L9Y2A7_9MICO|nr:ribokinase [Diaminobutyricibacter tongyongensis]
MTGKVTVVGSANVDIVTRVARIPAPGETVTADSLEVYPGGKGLNQAVAARRAGADTQLVAAIGNDAHGKIIIDVVAGEQMNPTRLRREEGPTGTAFVTIDAAGENNIVIVPGANGTLRRLAEDERELIRASGVLVCQLEVPDSVVEDAVSTAWEAGTAVVLNPTPVRAVPAAILAAVDVLIVNEHEAEQLHASDLPVPCVITTLGADGVKLDIRGESSVRIDARKTISIDSTGAGDTFVGFFAAAIAAGADYETAARRASVAGSLSVEEQGAVPSIPTKQAVDDALRLERVENQ